jgi:hypothetical protein
VPARISLYEQLACIIVTSANIVHTSSSSSCDVVLVLALALVLWEWLNSMK